MLHAFSRMAGRQSCIPQFGTQPLPGMNSRLPEVLHPAAPQSSANNATKNMVLMSQV